MNIFILSDKSDKSELGTTVKQSIIRAFDTKYDSCKNFNVHQEDLHYCVGCFGCWIKTPGICIFNDISGEINRSYIHSDIALILSPIKYGCYSPAVRNVLDRILPNLLPFFQKINNEVHHAPRYGNYPKFVAIGYGNDISVEEADTFRALTNANGINFQAGKSKTYICRNEADVPDILDSLDIYVKAGARA